MGDLLIAQNIPKAVSCHDEDIIFLNVMQSKVKYIHLENRGVNLVTISAMEQRGQGDETSLEMTHWDQSAWRKAKTCQVCRRCIQRSSLFNSTLQFPCAVTDLRNAGEERFDFNVGVDDLELMIPQASRDSQSPQQASLAPKQSKTGLKHQGVVPLKADVWLVLTDLCVAFRTFLQASPRTASGDFGAGGVIRSNGLMGVWRQPDCEWLHVVHGVLWS